MLAFATGGCLALPMAYLSIRDRRAIKSRKRLIRPLLAILGALITTGGLIYLSINKSASPSPPVVLAEPPVPSEADLRGEELALRLTELSEAARSNDLPKLEEVARAVLALDPHEGRAWGALGRLQSQQGDPTAALISLSKALQVSKDRTSLLSARAGVHRKLGDFPAALADLEEATKLDPSNAGVANRLLIFKIQAGQAEEVRSFISTYEQAAITSQKPLWLLGAAALSMQDGDPLKAASYLDSLKFLLAPQQFSELLSDPFFEPYQEVSALKRYFLLAQDTAE